MNAKKIFDYQMIGVENLIRASDVYLQNILAVLRGTKISFASVANVINKKGFSLGCFEWQWQLSREEYEYIQEHGHVKELSQQIVVAVYGAFELYMINKFREYMEGPLSSCSEEQKEKVLKRIKARSLDDLRINYKEFLKINIPQFSPKISVFENNWLNKIEPWDALKKYPVQEMKLLIREKRITRLLTLPMQ